MNSLPNDVEQIEQKVQITGEEIVSQPKKLVKKSVKERELESLKAKKNFVRIRSVLRGNVETILASLSSYRQSLKSDAEDLFATSSSDKPKILNGINPKVPDLPKFQLLLAEKESLGIYVSGNPLEQYRELLEWTKETANIDNLHLVLVEKIRKIFTKANQMMIAVQVSVMDEPLEMLVFPKNALRISPLLEEKQVYWVVGQLKIPKSLFADKKKTETETEEKKEPKKEGEFEMQEYKELPKLAVDNLALFEDGPTGVIDMDGLTKRRQDALNEVPWNKLLLQPELFLEMFSDKTEEQKPAKTNLPANQQIQNPTQNPNQNSVQNPTDIQQQKPNQNLPITLRLPASFGQQKLSKLKSYLLSDQISGTVPVVLEVEHQGDWKRVKGVFYIEEPVAQKVLGGSFE